MTLGNIYKTQGGWEARVCSIESNMFGVIHNGNVFRIHHSNGKSVGFDRRFDLIP